MRPTDDLSTNLIDSRPENSYNHTEENEVFVVGYQYKTDENCPEVKIKLSDIMNGEGGGGTPVEGDLLLAYDETNNRIYYTLGGEDAMYADDEHTTFDPSCRYITIPDNGGGGSFTIDDIDFGWLASNATATVQMQGSKMILRLPAPEGDGSGTPGQDGTTIDLYSVEITPTSFSQTSDYSAGGTSMPCSYFSITTSTALWKRFDPQLPAGSQYVTIAGAPAISSDQVVEVGLPDAVSPGNTAWNMTYGAFGMYSNGFHFYVIRKPEAPYGNIRFSVKVYNNITSPSSDASVHPGTEQ